METWAILASGPSMSQAIADSVRGRCKVIAVSDCFKLAPWADALVSQDKPWWKFHKPEFSGRKFSGGAENIEGTERVEFEGSIGTGTNSALLACHVAVKVFGAKRILLLGVDMGGTHFFGPHPEPLKNTKPERFEQMKLQFAHWVHKGVEVFNCSPDSALTCFPKATLEDCLSRPA
jgi:hypothetical protein